MSSERSPETEPKTAAESIIQSTGAKALATLSMFLYLYYMAGCSQNRMGQIVQTGDPEADQELRAVRDNCAATIGDGAEENCAEEIAARQEIFETTFGARNSQSNQPLSEAELRSLVKGLERWDWGSDLVLKTQVDSARCRRLPGCTAIFQG